MKFISMSTDTDTIGVLTTPSASQSTLKNVFCVKYFSMLSNETLDVSAVLLLLTKDMLGADVQLPTPLFASLSHHLTI